MYSFAGAGHVSNVRLVGASAAVGFISSSRRGGSLLSPRTGGFAATASIPDGYRAPDSYAMAISDGGLAGRMFLSGATTAASIGASGTLEATVTGQSTTTALANIGSQIFASISASASTSGVLSAIGQLLSNIRIGATPSTIDIADAVWSRAMSPFTTIGTFGYKLANLSGGGGGGGGGATASEIADAVWAWATRTLTSSSDPSAALIASQVRTELAVELGRIDAAITSRLASAGYTAPDNSSIAAIKSKTDNLPSDPASNTQVNTRLASASYTAPDNTGIADIKAKTDNLPSDPADQSLIISAISGIASAPSASSVASAVRTELATELARLDAAVSSRLASASYTAPDNSSISSIKSKTDQITFTSGNVNAVAQVVSDKTGYALSSTERDTLATLIESHLLNEGDGQALIDAIALAIGNQNIDQIALVAAVRADIERSGGMLDGKASQSSVTSVKNNTDLIPGLF